MPAPSAGADCARCAGLCCVALAFDRSEAFAFDKPAGQPCPLLDDENGCTCHGEREVAGLSGCVAYDCHGAGPVTTARHAPRDWRSGPDTAAEMFDTFRALGRLLALRSLLEAASRLELPAVARWELRQRDREVEALLAVGPEVLVVTPLGGLEARVHATLRGLADLLPAPGERRRLPVVG